MEGFLVLVYVVMFVWGILNIILFFKVWGMTNDVSDMLSEVKNILNILNSKDNRDMKLPQRAIHKSTGKKVIVVGLKNGKMLCEREDNKNWGQIDYNINELEFIKDEQENA